MVQFQLFSLERKAVNEVPSPRVINEALRLMCVVDSAVNNLGIWVVNGTNSPSDQAGYNNKIDRLFDNMGLNAKPDDQINVSGKPVEAADKSVIKGGVLSLETIRGAITRIHENQPEAAQQEGPRTAGLDSKIIQFPDIIGDRTGVKQTLPGRQSDAVVVPASSKVTQLPAQAPTQGGNRADFQQAA